MLIDRWRKAGHMKELVPVTLQEGREYDIKIEFYDNTGRSEVRLIWNAGVSDQSDQQIEEAYRVAEEADVVVVVAGIEEGEFQDRARLHLPGKQEDMILKLAELNKPLVVLLVGGSAITMNRWIDMVPAVIDVWYPGEMGGHAVADVLFGDYNPAGRLPVTFPQDVAQVPLYYNNFPTGRGDDYIDMTGFPRYPFGHGLSYSEFEYSGLTLSEEQIDKAGTLTLGMSVKNVSDRDGEEVVQLYVRDLVSTIVRPVMVLKGFKRIFVKAGEEKQVQFTLQAADLGYYHPDGSFVIEPGRFEVMIGGSSADIRLKRTFHVSE
jgi:beta-glucosidase